MSEQRALLSLEEYLGEVLALVTPLGDRETVALADASGRTLGEPVTSAGDIPAFANAAMDGFGIRRGEVSAGAVLRIVAEVPAGSGADPAVGPGECVRIMTGAALPRSVDTVVPVELTSPAGSGVRLDRVPDAGAHVRHPAEDLAAGDVVLAAGATLGPRQLALVAAAGRGQVVAVRRPVVGVAATGDELVTPGRPLRRGQIYESNATFLSAAAARDGARVLRAGPVPDDEASFARALDELAAGADLVVLSGGVSVGDRDVARIVLSRGDAAFRHVAMQPGKPQGWARYAAPGGRTVPVVALPGNPLSTALSYEVFVRPALDRLLGRSSPGWTRAVAGEEWRSPPGRRQLVPVTIEVDAEGRQVVRAAHRRGSASHLVSALAHADGIARVAEAVSGVVPGDLVEVRRLT